MAPRSSRANDAAASSRQRIVDHLSSQGGRITSPDGRGLTASLAKAAGYTDLGVLNAMLSRLEKEGVGLAVSLAVVTPEKGRGERSVPFGPVVERRGRAVEIPG